MTPARVPAQQFTTTSTVGRLATANKPNTFSNGSTNQALRLNSSINKPVNGGFTATLNKPRAITGTARDLNLAPKTNAKPKTRLLSELMKENHTIAQNDVLKARKNFANAQFNGNVGEQLQATANLAAARKAKAEADLTFAKYQTQKINGQLDMQNAVIARKDAQVMRDYQALQKSKNLDNQNFYNTNPDGSPNYDYASNTRQLDANLHFSNKDLVALKKERDAMKDQLKQTTTMQNTANVLLKPYTIRAESSQAGLQAYQAALKNGQSVSEAQQAARNATGAQKVISTIQQGFEPTLGSQYKTGSTGN